MIKSMNTMIMYLFLKQLDWNATNSFRVLTTVEL